MANTNLDSFPSSPSNVPAHLHPQREHDSDAASIVSPASELPSTSITSKLYISHFLSTWNSRVFEFGAVLYLATIYPETLMPMSIYALARAASAIIFSPAIGRYIDTANRLRVVRLSIVLQRLVVAVSCVMFWSLVTDRHWARSTGSGNLVILAALGCIEKLCSIMNLISIEKDWVVVIAGHNENALTALNVQMRRIDLICKLAGPFVIAIIDSYSTEVAVLVNLGMNLFSVVVEYYTIAKVYTIVPALQEPKTLPVPLDNELSSTDEPAAHGRILESWNYLTSGLLQSIQSTLHEFNIYLHHRAFRPSFSNALLYFTVLSFSGQMITYLVLSAGYDSIHIAVARALSVAFEISATWFAPVFISKINPIRTGMWFINWQIVCLGIGAAWFWTTTTTMTSFGAASGLVAGTIFSRVGLWGFDLSVQVLVQQEVEPQIRGTFSSVEASWQNLFELCAFGSTIIFSKPEEFQWPVLMSLIAVSTAGIVYASFVRHRRGHLLHVPPCISIGTERKRTRPVGVGDEGYELIVELDSMDA